MAEIPASDAEVDAILDAKMAGLTAEQWRELRDLLAELDATADAGAAAEPWGIWHNTGVDGTITFPYVQYSALASRAMGELGRLELFAVFDWPDWFARSVYADHPELTELASPTDAVRLFVRLVRGERFSEGAFYRALEDGTVQTLLRRILTHPAAAD